MCEWSDIGMEDEKNGINWGKKRLLERERNEIKPKMGWKTKFDIFCNFDI